MVATHEVLRIKRELEQGLNLRLDEHTRLLVQAWALMWAEVVDEAQSAADDLVAGAKDGRVTYRQAIRSTRVARALRAIADALEELARRTGVIITDRLDQMVEDAAKGNLAMIAAQLPRGVGIDFARVDARALAAIVQRVTERITAKAYALSPAGQAAIRRELLRALPVGDNPRVTARRIVTRTEDTFNGGLTRALTIARTETLDAHRAASREADRARADVLQGWQWVASLGPRTCPACIGMHGSVHDLETPGPQGHPNCRCSRVPATKSWADLGFDVPEPPSLLPDAQAWFEGLDVDTQRSILGPTRFEAWLAGEFPLSAWAVRRDNPDWRPSFVPAPAPRVLRATA